MTKPKRKPYVLLIMDGWGIGKPDDSNAIHLAKKPHFDSYVKNYPYAELKAASTYVGLPLGQAGNSEAGHMNIGAGRVVEQDSVIISRSISDGTFFKNPAFLQSVDHAKKNTSRVHLLGMLSDGQSAHSDPDHLMALIMFLQKQKIRQVYIHLFTDGRDSARYSAIKILRKYKSLFHYQAKIATVIGRFYAMDRKKAWHRTKMAYDAMVRGQAPAEVSSAEEAILQAYNRGESDEYISPTVITSRGKPIARVADNDTVIFFNLRSDRARQMSKPFVQEKFESENSHSFRRVKVLKNIFFVAMTDFGPDLGNILTAYPSRDLIDCLPVVFKSIRQLYISENEKYAHMTYFFNGGYDHPVAGEERVMLESPQVMAYDRTPRMGLPAITNYIVRVLERDQYDFIAANISNPDMLAHTGNMQATIKAIEFVDTCLHRIVRSVLARHGTVIITADHGNAEKLINLQTGEIDTEHSVSKVPFIIVSDVQLKLRKQGVLGDVAPTILELMSMVQPTAMLGKSLIA